MTGEFVIREYRASDHDRVVALNAYGLAAAGVPADADVYAGDLDDVDATYLTGRAALIVGEIGDEIVAMGALREIDQTTCEITRMRVAPHVQGRGYGKAILTSLEDTARRYGYRRATLITGPEQHPAIDLYKAANYTIARSERHGLLLGIRMEKSLSHPPTVQNGQAGAVRGTDTEDEQNRDPKPGYRCDSAIRVRLVGGTGASSSELSQPGITGRLRLPWATIKDRHGDSTLGDEHDTRG